MTFKVLKEGFIELMNIDLCLYENENAGMLEPLALTRPVFSLLLGLKFFEIIGKNHSMVVTLRKSHQ